LRPQPVWWHDDYWQRFTGCQVYIINRYLDTSFQMQLESLRLDESTGRMTFTIAWAAIGVDAENRRSLTRRASWVNDDEPLTELDLWANMGDTLMPLYTGRPVSDGRLILDGGELMEAVFTFLPAGSAQNIAQDQIKPVDPTRPIDRKNVYVAGHMPGGLPLPTGHRVALYKADSDGNPQRENLDDGQL
jgi:hypothetical protein